LIARFKGQPTGLLREIQPLRWLVNVNVLTTGFDAQNIDCICLVRPTLSPGLYYQMVGRGFRIHETKTDCLVLDYGSNILRHGPVDAINSKKIGNEKKNDTINAAPCRECPTCHFVLPINVSRCFNCGYVFPIPEPNSKLDDKASKDGILSGQKKETEYEVLEVIYSKHYKKHAADNAPTTLKVEFRIAGYEYVTKWVCPEHEGWVRTGKFIPWWKMRTDIKPPTSTDEALYYANNGCLAMPKRIIVIETAGQKFPEIIEKDFTEKPAPPEYPYVPDDTELVPKETIESNKMTCSNCIHYFGESCGLNAVMVSPDLCSDFIELYDYNSTNFDNVPF
jgi:DNA repair protein RadD